ncbi:hypothetical protein F2Q69_00050541 [Brassica cretica]|uniref:Uncharacterized protein n=1 Tax=Brassica cretica TaxID=69181 RepID=A0A8S9Q3A8_BRACR|nr:hypothetical protein F2Q69_00050541 [Brassica cretica]
MAVVLNPTVGYFILVVTSSPLLDNHVSVLNQSSSPTRKDRRTHSSYDKARNDDRLTSSYRERVDRHGNPFGNRVSLESNRVQGPRNKIAPTSTIDHSYQKYRSIQPEGAAPYNTSPPYVRSSYQPELVREGSKESQQSSKLQWRSKDTRQEDKNKDNSLQTTPTRKTVERHLEASDFPPPHIPTTDEVLEDINEATLRYMNVDDPVERAARQQRVVESELNGMVEETVNNIITAAESAVAASIAPILPTSPTLTSTQEAGHLCEDVTCLRGSHLLD